MNLTEVIKLAQYMAALGARKTGFSKNSMEALNSMNCCTPKALGKVLYTNVFAI